MQQLAARRSCPAGVFSSRNSSTRWPSSLVAAAPPPLCRLLRAASPNSDPQQQQQEDSKPGSAMPRLPERKQLHKPAPPPPRASSRTTPPSLPPPEEFQQQAQERTLAGSLAYAGLLGTLATGASFVLPGVDLFSGWDLSSSADITLALQLLLPCCALNLAIMLPDYSSWKVPSPAEPTLEAQQRMAEALLDWTAKQKAAKAAAAASTGSSSSSSTSTAGDAASAASADADAPAAAVTLASSTSSRDTASTSSSSAKAAAGSDQGASHKPSSPSPSSSTTSGSTTGPDPAVSPPWLISNPDPPLPLALARCKDALLMAQGHYLSSMPRVPLPWGTQAVLLLVNCLAAELLYRSVLLQVSGGWLSDRILEAGAEDYFLSAAAHLPVLPTPHMTGQLAAVALLSGAWGVAVVRQVLRMSRRPSLAMASQGRVASGKLYADMQQLTAAPRDSSNKQEQEQQAGDSSSSSEASSQPAQDGPAAAADSNAPSASHKAAKYAEAAAAAAAGGEAPSSSGSSSSKRMLGRRGLTAQLPNALGALALSQVVTGVRDLSQTLGLSLAFALTGNLAAPFVAAVVTEGLMAVLQQRGQERSRQRSIAFAKHFASFTRVFRDTQRKQQLKQQEVADTTAAASGSQQEQGQQQQHSLPLAAAATAAHDASDGALDAAVAAAGAVALHAAASQEGGAAAAAPSMSSAASTTSTRGSRMEQTIGVLDQLLGEQLAEQAAAGSSK